MPRRVAHEFTETSLRLVSPGVYDVTILLNADDVLVIRGAKWCYEQTKGLVYTMDLSMVLPRAMGYSTPRVYLRDYILYLHGYDHRKVIWRRRELLDYRLESAALLSV